MEGLTENGAQKGKSTEAAMAYRAKGRKKDFPVFDCDSHIYEPPEIWDKYIPQKHQPFAKTHFYRDADRLILVRNSLCRGKRSAILGNVRMRKVRIEQ
jgi:hypothetical protein